MNFEPDKFYHIYNRSNELVFHSDDNYIFFLQKIKKLIIPHCEIVAWCLMPNHFHFLVQVKSSGCEYINESHRSNTQVLSKNIGSLLSGYSKAINKQLNRRGSLFSHKTKAKCLNSELNNPDYLNSCFFYIHQNPLSAGLCDRLTNWKYSSFLDYANLRSGALINKKIAYEGIRIDEENFEKQCNTIISEKHLKGFW